MGETLQRCNPIGEGEEEGEGRLRGFEQRLDPGKIVWATNLSGEIKFLIKWEGSDKADLVLAKEANIKIPKNV